MTTPLLQLQHVSKQYKKQPAIDDITIRFSSGKKRRDPVSSG